MEKTTPTGGADDNLVAARFDDWNGKDDEGNPRNFPLWQRAFATAAVSFLALVSTFAASLYSPGHSSVSRDFRVSEEVSILPLSMYNLGLAIGPLVGAPLSETFGRKVVFLTTTPVFALFTIGAGFSPDILSLIVCRFFAGVFAAPNINNASATITDYTAPRYRTISLAVYYSIPWFGAMLGPLVGGFIVEKKSWRWTQWTTIFFIIAFYVPVLFTRETYKRTILRRRAQKAGIALERLSVREASRYFLRTLVVRPAHMLVSEPIVALVCTYNGFMFGLMYTFVVASPWVYENYYAFDLTAQSLSFLGLMIGTITAPISLTIMDLYIYQPKLKRWKQTSQERFPPEHRLYPALVASFVLPVALLVFAWTARSTISWVCPIIFQAIAIHASVIIYASASLFVLDAYGPLYGASAAGASMLSRYMLSAAFPLFSLQMYRGLGVGWATSLLALCTLIMAPIPWLFWKYGNVLRERSKYETSI